MRENQWEVLPAYNGYLWESGYDASQEESHSFHIPCNEIPCNEIIQHFNLQQKTYDGYYYDKDTLVAFDAKLRGIGNELIMREDYLNRFMDEKSYGLFWTILGEKQIILEDFEQIRSEWNGLAYFDNNSVAGGIRLTKSSKSH